jgi:hypothetical protein
MSHEYKMVCSNDLITRRIMEALRLSDFCVRADHEFVYLKDLITRTDADYDARLSHDHPNSLWVEVNFKSLTLYDLVRDALDGAPCKCFSDGDLNDEVTLGEVFQLRDVQTENSRVRK